jgi:hypothetical protein
VLRLRGAALQLRLAPLKLLLGSIASNVYESSLCDGYLRVLGFGPLPLNSDRVNFLFLKSFINSNHFDPNSNLNYERLVHVKKNTQEYFITQ